MSTKKKVVSVTRKASVEDALNSVRWTEFVRTCALPYDDLTVEWFDFYEAMGDWNTPSSELERLVDRAIQKDIEAQVVQEELK